MRYAVLLILISAVLAGGCTQVSFPPAVVYPAVEVGTRLAANLDDACVADYRPDVDYFPDKTTFTHSSQLSVSYGPHYKRVQFRPPVDTSRAVEYLLVQCGTPVPPHDRETVVIEVPVATIASGYYSIMGALVDLGLEDRLIGVHNLQEITVPEIRERIRKGLVREMAVDVHHGIEPILAGRPDVWLGWYNWAYPEHDLHPKLRELGVRTVMLAEEQESHPLGGAEWLKLLALLANREARADARFEGIVARYEAVAERAREASAHTVVLHGHFAGRDAFSIPNGSQPLVRLIEDAGGRYVFADLGRGDLGSWFIHPFEWVYARSATAPVWAGGPQGKTTVAGLIAQNARYGWFESVQNNRVYSFDLGYRGDWAYPYWDDSLTRPDVLLAEVLHAIHPELFSTPPEARYVRHLQ